MNYHRGKKAEILFFFLIATFLVISISIYQPSVHYFFDAIGIRDGNIYLSMISFTFEDIRKFIRAAVYHVHGPLPYIVSNIYYLLIGDIAGLGPKAVQSLNVIIIFFTSFYCFLLGKKVHSPKFGYIFALLYILSPWTIQTVRTPFLVYVFSPLLHILVVYYYTLFIHEPDKKLYKILGPLCLTLYLGIALDWPPFFIFLFGYIFLTGRLKEFLRNKYNLMPVGLFLIWIAWFLRLVIADAPVIITPFNHVFRTSLKFLDFDKYYAFFYFDTLGLVGICALIGFFLVIKSRWDFIRRAFVAPGWFLFSYPKDSANRIDIPHIWKSLYLANAAWFLMSLVPLVSTSTRASFGFVIGISMAFVAAFLLERFSSKLVSLLAVVMTVNSAWAVIEMAPIAGFRHDQQYQYAGPIGGRYDDRRVLAMAAYLNEHRQDLMTADKTAYVPRNVPANALQYARGKNRRIITRENFTRYLSENAIERYIREKDAIDFVTSYKDKGEIKADWLMLIPRLLELPDYKPSRDFFIRLKNDPRIYWSVRLRDRYGREVWLGEVRDKGQAIEKAKVMDVEPLAKLYQEKYNRLSFLKRNLDFLNKY